MRTLVIKEVRLLLPALAGALALAILPIWIIPYDPYSHDSWPSYLFLFGSMLLALSSFGREISLKTLSFALAQPTERAQIWRTKIGVLAIALFVIFDAWMVSGSLRSMLMPDLSVDLLDVVSMGLMAVVFAAGGLWMTLLLRQTIAAFWLTLLIPTGVITAIKTFRGPDALAALALGVYAVAGFFLARRRFFDVQDTAWTGGVIALGGGQAAMARAALRGHRPWGALFWKEIQLQQITLIGMGCLLLLHLAVTAIRDVGEKSFNRSTLMMLDAFGALWFFVPLLAGSQCVAEERKFGTMQAHLCLPVSRRRQWFVKLTVVLAVALASMVIFCAVQELGGKDLFTSEFFVMFLGLALAGFYGSTLTSGVVQALAASALAMLGVFVSLIVPYLPLTNTRSEYITLCTGSLPLFMGWPILLVTVIWLAYRNFGHATESMALWRRNALTLAGTSALSLSVTVAVYYRAWERLTPMEPPHGAAQIFLQKPPLLKSYGGLSLAVLLPDGRLWDDSLNYDRRRLSGGLALGDQWMILGNHQFAAGSNWLDSVANWRQTVAIRSDGTLWVSEKPRKDWNSVAPKQAEPSAPLVQFGQTSNWLSVARLPDWGVFLLARDGSLWTWGTDAFDPKQAKPGLQSFPPRRLGEDSDWIKLMGSKGWIYAFAWKKDGSAWVLHDSRRQETYLQNTRQMQPGLYLSRLSCLDHTQWRSLTASDNFAFAGVRDDGTLWYQYETPGRKRTAGTTTLLQSGKDSDWAELAASSDRLAARKTDGSLWKWERKPGGFWYWEPFGALREPPERMGTHSDWVALGVVYGDVVSLTQDGGLWGWPSLAPVAIFGDDDFSLELAASKKPTLIESIFGAK